MEQSLFAQYLAKYFGLVIGKVTEKFNDEKARPTLLHKTMLTEEYSVDLKWGSTAIANSIVAADVVSLDASLPLKSRPKMSNASGTLPKLGIKFKKGESDIQTINLMIAKGNNEAMVAGKILDDVPRIADGMDVRKEIMFEQALSDGASEVSGEENNGTAVRVKFNYKTENTVTPAKAWNATGATPISDLRKMFDLAEDNADSIGVLLIQRTWLDNIKNTDEAKQLLATSNRQVVTDKSLLASPTRKQLIELLEGEFDVKVVIVKSSFRVELEDGTHKVIKPWRDGMVVGTPQEKVGRLVYGTLAEETNPVQGVNYHKAGTHVLISKYSHNEPSLEEITAGQAICLPVIDGAESIYRINAAKASL